MKNEWVEKKVAEYIKKFGLCKDGGNCACLSEIKWLRKTLNEKVTKKINN
tara:strand:+ start:34909 stop:35058 length:150 start_codon:yes stop_codon:yes gene_type:complete